MDSQGGQLLEPRNAQKQVITALLLNELPCQGFRTHGKLLNGTELPTNEGTLHHHPENTCPWFRIPLDDWILSPVQAYYPYLKPDPPG